MICSLKINVILAPGLERDRDRDRDLTAEQPSTPYLYKSSLLHYNLDQNFIVDRTLLSSSRYLSFYSFIEEIVKVD